MLVRLGRRGTVTIPKALRADLPPGTPWLVVRRDDGVIELRPQAPIDADQAWFWTRRWQAMEREADADFAAGRVHIFANVDDFLTALDEHARSDG